MDDIKINLITPIQLNNALKTSISKDNRAENNPSVVNQSHSGSSDGLARLLNIIKTSSGDARSLDAVEKIRSQVASGEYTVDMLLLVENLYQELSFDGDFNEA